MEALCTRCSRRTTSTLLAVIVLLPLLGAFVNGVFGKRLGKRGRDADGRSPRIGGSFVAERRRASSCSTRARRRRAEQAARSPGRGWEWVQLSLAGERRRRSPIDVALLASTR